MQQIISFVKHHSTWLCIFFSSLFIVAHSIYLQPWTLDDAYISMRYGYNFAEGHGLVYNIGERVEGYTTFLWVVLIGFWAFLGFEPEIMVKVMGFFFAIGTIVLLSNAHRFIKGLDKTPGIFATGVLSTCGIFTVWVMSGMEVSMVGFWILLAVLWHYRSKDSPQQKLPILITAVSCFLATISRPECGLIFVILWLDHFLSGIRKRNYNFLLLGGTFSGLYIPYFIWRYTYYGYLLPNTFYVKVGSSWSQLKRGLLYVDKFSWVALLIIVLALCTIFFRSAILKKYRSLNTIIAIIVVHTLYVISVGGDVMPAFRFFATIFPLICLLAGLAVGALSQTRLGIVGIFLTVVTFNGFQTVIHNELNHRVINGKIGLFGKELGLWMRENLPPDTVIATNAAGGVAYFSRLRVIDMLGLNDTHIAHREMPNMGKGMPGHEKGDGQYVLSLKPDYIFFQTPLGKAKPFFVGDREIAQDETFQRDYELKAFRLPSGKKVRTFKRKDIDSR